MIQQPRVLRPHHDQHGLDVLAQKRALRIWEVERGRELILHWPPTAKYGAGAVAAVRHFQYRHNMTTDGVLGPRTYANLYPWLGAYERSLLALYVRRHPTRTERDKVTTQLRWLLANHEAILYQQSRPVPLARFREHLLPIYSDCSGSIIGAFFAAGAPDPGGNGYDGSGNTASFLGHLSHIPRSAIAPGDLVVYGYYPGIHAVAYLGAGMIYTHGHEGYPDDPREMPLVDMDAYFSALGFGSTTLRSPLS